MHEQGPGRGGVLPHARLGERGNRVITFITQRGRYINKWHHVSHEFNFISRTENDLIKFLIWSD